MTTVHVRKAVPEDHSAIVILQTAAALETEGRVLVPDEVARGVSKVLSGGIQDYYLVAETNAVLVGCLMVSPEWSDWSGKQQLWLNSIYVLREWRRQGVLRTMFKHLTTVSTADTVVRFKLYVDTRNVIGRDVYDALGWVEQSYRLYEYVLPTWSRKG